MEPNKYKENSSFNQGENSASIMDPLAFLDAFSCFWYFGKVVEETR